MGPCHHRVLVVDPCRDTVTSLSMLLYLWGHEVRCATDGLAALETAAEFRPTVVLSEIRLGRLDGCALARRLRELPEMYHALLVAVTGRGDAGALRLCREAGFDRHIIKPADPEELRQLLAGESAASCPRLPEPLRIRMDRNFPVPQGFILDGSLLWVTASAVARRNLYGCRR